MAVYNGLVLSSGDDLVLQNGDVSFYTTINNGGREDIL